MKTPSVVLDAFFPATVTVAGLVLKHPFTIKHWLALERIKSPFAQADGPITLLEAVKALYVVAMPAAEVFDRVRTDQGKFEEEAVDLAGRIPMAEAAGIAKAVAKHINAAFVTAPAANESPEEGDAESGFPFASHGKARAGSSRSSRKSAAKRSTSTRQ